MLILSTTHAKAHYLSRAAHAIFGEKEENLYLSPVFDDICPLNNSFAHAFEGLLKSTSFEDGQIESGLTMHMHEIFLPKFDLF